MAGGASAGPAWGEVPIAMVPATLLLAGAGSLLASRFGQPARLAGLAFGPLPWHLAPWVVLLTLLARVLGVGLARLLNPLAGWMGRSLRRRPLAGALLLAASLSGLAVASGGLSLNDGSLSLGAALSGQPGGDLFTVLWRSLATLLSIAAGAPGGLMHDCMTLGALLSSPLQGRFGLGASELGQLAAVGAPAAFAAAQGTPVICAVFVVTLQGDAALLPVLLLVSALSGGGTRWARGLPPAWIPWWCWTASGSKRCARRTSGNCCSRRITLGRRPRRCLVAISQAVAALAFTEAAGSLQTFIAALESFEP